jgi:hypothetical protein
LQQPTAAGLGLRHLNLTSVDLQQQQQKQQVSYSLSKTSCDSYQIDCSNCSSSGPAQQLHETVGQDAAVSGKPMRGWGVPCAAACVVNKKRQHIARPRLHTAVCRCYSPAHRMTRAGAFAAQHTVHHCHSSSTGFSHHSQISNGMSFLSFQLL